MPTPCKNCGEQIIFKKKLDERGNPILKTDENGKPLYRNGKVQYRYDRPTLLDGSPHNCYSSEVSAIDSGEGATEAQANTALERYLEKKFIPTFEKFVKKSINDAVSNIYTTTSIDNRLANDMFHLMKFDHELIKAVAMKNGLATAADLYEQEKEAGLHELEKTIVPSDAQATDDELQESPSDGSQIDIV